MARNDTPIGRGDTIKGQRRVYPLQRPSSKPNQYLGMSIDRTGWTDQAATLTLTLEAFMDNQWSHWCGYTDYGSAGGQGRSALVATPPPDGVMVRLVAQTNGRDVSQPFDFVEMD